MKKLLIIALAFVSLQAVAQDKKKDGMEIRKERMEQYQAMTADEMATIQTKQMTLKLDLNEAQQKKIKAINLEEAQLRKSNMEERKAMKGEEKQEMTKDQRVAKMNERLDHQIAMKAKMKEILNEEQYTKWEASHKRGLRDGHRQAKREPMKRNRQ